MCHNLVPGRSESFPENSLFMMSLRHLEKRGTTRAAEPRCEEAGGEGAERTSFAQIMASVEDLRPLLTLGPAETSRVRRRNHHHHDRDEKTSQPSLVQDLSSLLERRRMDWDWKFQGTAASSSSSSSSSPKCLDFAPQDLETLLSLSRSFRQEMEVCGEEFEGYARDCASVAFDAVFDWLGATLARALKGEGGAAHNLAPEWMCSKAVQLMQNFEFCRAQSHGGYLGLLREAVRALRTSEGSAKLALGDCLDNLDRTAREETNASLFPKTYFFLRMLPVMAPNLGEDLAQTRLLDLLMLFSDRNATHSDEVCKLAHECVCQVLVHAPSTTRPKAECGTGKEWDDCCFGISYVEAALRRYPLSMPYNPLAMAVVTLVRAQGEESRVPERICRMLAAAAVRVAEAGDDVRASAVRKLMFGVCGVAPLGQVARLLALYEAEIGDSRGKHGAGPHDLLTEFAAVLDAIGDYNRKPDLSSWLQRMGTRVGGQARL